MPYLLNTCENKVHGIIPGSIMYLTLKIVALKYLSSWGDKTHMQNRRIFTEGNPKCQMTG